MNEWKTQIDAEERVLNDRQRELYELQRINKLQQRAFETWKRNPHLIRLAVHDATSPLVAQLTIRFYEEEGYFSHGMDNWEFSQLKNMGDNIVSNIGNKMKGILVAFFLDTESISKLPTTKAKWGGCSTQYDATVEVPIRFIE